MVTPLTILQIVHGLPPDSPGGVEHYTWTLCRALASAGHAVHVLRPVHDPAAPELALSSDIREGVTVHTLTTPMGDPFNHLADPAVEAAVTGLLCDLGPDVAHIQHTYFSLPLSLLPLAAAMVPATCCTLHDFWLLCIRAHLYRDFEDAFCSGPESPGKCARCVARSYSFQTPEEHEGFVQSRTAFMAARLTAAQKALEAVDLVAAASRFVLDTHGRYLQFPRPPLLRPFGMAPPPEPAAERAPGPLRFVYMGAVNPLKNLRTLLEAFRGVEGPARVHIFGQVQSREEAAALRAAMQQDKRIIYHGPYAPENLGHILALADVGVVPSRMETYSLTVREFLGGGVPVVAARAGALPEAVEESVTGVLFDPERPDELAAVLQTLVDTPGRVETMAAALRRGEGARIPSVEEEARAWEADYTAIQARGGRRPPRR